MGSWSLAIDFGTSFTTAAAKMSDGVPELLEIENSRYFPSLVCLDTDGTLLSGSAARQLAAQLPGHAERSPKRALASAAQVRLAGRSVATTDLVAAVLARVHTEAVQRYGGPPADVVLTHPAAWSTEELALLRTAARTAGMPDVTLVSEPVAAALHYATGKPAPIGSHLAIYDLGGGTFDTAVVRRTQDPPGLVVVGAPGGDPFLGGEDFDEALRDLVGALAVTRDPGPWEALWSGTDRPALRAQRMLRRDVTEARETLSTRTTVQLHVPGYADLLVVHRPQFEAAIDPLLRRSVDELLSTVSGAGLHVDDLAAVVLTGGASRTPRVSDLIAERLGRLPDAAPDPKGVVALGALLGDHAPAPAHRSPGRPTPQPGRRPLIHLGMERDLFSDDPPHPATDGRNPWRS
ncbi:Hsp70 family protein [Solwaraspora sp. WMMD791]|uniref:Hsp70 family protein n=1 Tax=Solwaraspora sp. WMMD791 TaxID=3016086 RepID=UPI00249BFBFF|nr:Hsp70 family protein [Solwaraspora sp. WMMD791]WFE29288.1 Hsp70 family protein [Solwaraspora sp. WMMD791]